MTVICCLLFYFGMLLIVTVKIRGYVNFLQGLLTGTRRYLHTELERVTIVSVTSTSHQSFSIKPAPFFSIPPWSKRREIFVEKAVNVYLILP